MSSEKDNRPLVVAVGGGTGTHTVLRGLVTHSDAVRLAAVVSMADSGGSTGRLRDEFGYLPVGDVRNALCALAMADDDHGRLLRELFLYRFEKGNGLLGHNFGNLLLTALTDILGGEEEAIAAAARLLRVAGEVIPVTADNVQLAATYDDGVTVIGESLIDEPPPERAPRRITSLALTPTARLSETAAAVLAEARVLVLGPGDLYTSVLPNIIVDGFAEALQKSPARLVYVSNLMSRPGQTHGMTVRDHVDEIARYAGRRPDHVVVNSESLPDDLVARYTAQGDQPVVCDVAGECGVVYLPLLAHAPVAVSGGDTVRRSLVRHDPQRLAAVLLAVLEK